VTDTLIPRTNLWLERDGHVVLSRWRADLLAAIEETGSISAAAERMHVEYRCAWDKIDEMERGLDTRLVERWTGGPAGGGARLTPEGRNYVARFKHLAEGIDELVAERFSEAFGSITMVVGAGEAAAEV
jgi:molybdate transport system regulatory protein